MRDVCRTPNPARALFPKYLILFITGLLISKNGFGKNHIWLTMLISVLAVMYCTYGFIKWHSGIKSKYFYEE